MQKIKYLLLMVLFLPLGWADQNSSQLNGLFDQLLQAENREQAQEAEREIWQIWLESGVPEADRRMNSGIRAMSRGNLEESIRHFDRVIEMLPEFAEGWNKRATAYYLYGDLGASMQDIQKTLELEPRHFGAISGIGLIFLKTGDEQAALDAFEEVLKIYPLAHGAGIHSERLREKLKEDNINL